MAGVEFDGAEHMVSPPVLARWLVNEAERVPVPIGLMRNGADRVVMTGQLRWKPG
jgi:hypothetical protein